MQEEDKEKKPNWDSFEVYTGPDNELKAPSWISGLLHIFAVSILYAVVIGIFGLFAYLLPFLLFFFRPRIWEYYMEHFTVQRFTFGAIIGAILVIHYHRKK